MCYNIIMVRKLLQSPTPTNEVFSFQRATAPGPSMSLKSRIQRTLWYKKLEKEKMLANLAQFHAL